MGANGNLTVTNVTWNDAGVYRCIARSSLGSALSLKAVIRIACEYYPSLQRGFQLIYRKINLPLANHRRQSVHNQSQNAKHCILNTVEPLHRSQTSFSRCKFAHKGRREGGNWLLIAALRSPSRGPSLVVASHLHFALAFAPDQRAKMQQLGRQVEPLLRGSNIIFLVIVVLKRSVVDID